MPNSWKDSRRITADSSCYLYGISVTRSCCVSTGVSYTWVFMYPPRNGNPMVSGQLSERVRLLHLHVQSICCQRCRSNRDTTRSCGMTTSSSHPWYAGNLSKSSAWLNVLIYKMYRSWWRPYWAPSVSEWKCIYWQYFNCLLFYFTAFLASVAQTAYVLLHILETLTR